MRKKGLKELLKIRPQTRCGGNAVFFCDAIRSKTPPEIPKITDPDEPVEDGVCPICGKSHNGGIFDRLIGFIHSLIAIFRNLFSGRSFNC